MAFRKKKSSIMFVMLLLLTAFAGMQTPVNASGEPPTANAGGPYTGLEGSLVILDASGSSDPEGDPLTYRWNIDGVWIENYYYPYLDWIWYDDYFGDVILEVSDGTNTSSDTAQVTISNVPPVILSIEGPTEVDVGDEFVVSVNFNRMPDSRDQMPSLDTHLVTFLWGDGSQTTLSFEAEEIFASASHLYEEEGFYHITITISDDDGGEAIGGWDILAGDITRVEAGPDAVIDEGSVFLSSGHIADSDAQTFIAIVDYYDDTEPQELFLKPGNTFDLQHRYLDDGVYTVLVTVFNEGAEYGSDYATVTVNNVAPTIESLSVSPTGPLQPGVPFKVTGVFSDPGVLDTHTVTIEWGDGTSTNVAMDVGVTTFEDSHVYEKAADYEIVVTLTDDDGGSNQAGMVVVVKSSAVSVDRLRQYIVGLKIPKGFQNMLFSLLDIIPRLLERHRLKAAIHQLEAFIRFVEAQSGKKLPREQAKDLIQTTRSIVAVLQKA